jgi:transposase-like protein
MAFRDTDMSLVIRRRPKEAIAQIMAAYASADYVIEKVAQSYGVTVRTVSRWIRTLGIDERIRRARTQARKGRRSAAA